MVRGLRKVTGGCGAPVTFDRVPLGLVAALLHGPDVAVMCLVAGFATSPAVGYLAALAWVARVVVTARPGGRRR